MMVLDHQQILVIHAAALDAGLGNNRDVLLSGIAEDFRATLRDPGASSSAILTDLHALNAAGRLNDGSVPLLLWLQNAEAIARAREESAIFREMHRLGSGTMSRGHDMTGADNSLRRVEVMRPMTASRVTEAARQGSTVAQGNERLISELQDALARERTLGQKISELEKRLFERQREFRRIIASDRLRASRRLLDLIVKLRNILVALPSQLLDPFSNESLSTAEKFERVKSTALAKVDDLASLFRGDAALVNVVESFEELVAATKASISGIPYPSEILLPRAELDELIRSCGKALVAIPAGGLGFRDIGIAIEGGARRRVADVMRRYNDWWVLSRTRVEEANAKLHHALTEALINVDERNHDMPDADSRV
jgi:hypothetical protein